MFQIIFFLFYLIHSQIEICITQFNQKSEQKYKIAKLTTSIQVSLADKYPDRVPILLEITDKSKIRFSDGSQCKKYLVSKSDHFYHFFQILRNSLKLSKKEAIYLFVNNSGLIKPESQVGEIYSKHRSSDGFLRIILSEYATFG